jgi:peptide deformylase
MGANKMIRAKIISIITMMILSSCSNSLIVTDPDQLSNKSIMIAKFTSEDKKKIEEMKEVMIDHNLNVIASPVIGYNKSIILIRDGDIYQTLLNPVIIKSSGQKKAIEKSIVIPDIAAVVTRSKDITVLYNDEKLKDQKKTFNNAIAAEIQQNVDLLNGITILDIANDVIKN